MTKDVCLSFDDVILIPQYSTIRSRSDVDTSTDLWTCRLKTPIISANMETVTGVDMAIEMWRAGGIGALHRFWSVGQNVVAYQEVAKCVCDCFVSIGVNGDSKERALALYNVGARMFIIDIAHGHSVMMRETIEFLRSAFGNAVFIVAGNVATPEAVEDLEYWGADCIKVGIGQGSICTTRKVTGHGVPSFTSILECCEKAKKCKIIADGGMKNSGDICKALVAGADYVMIGSLLAGSIDSPGEVIDGKKIYMGSSTYDKPGVTKEGVSVKIPLKGSAKQIIGDLTGGIRSGMSYSDARNLFEFKVKAKWRTQTYNSELEGRPHIFEK